MPPNVSRWNVDRARTRSLATAVDGEVQWVQSLLSVPVIAVPTRDQRKRLARLIILFCVNRSSRTKLCTILNSYCFFQWLAFIDRQYWPKQFLLHGSIIIFILVKKDRWFQPIASNRNSAPSLVRQLLKFVMCSILTGVIKGPKWPGAPFPSRNLHVFLLFTAYITEDQ